MQIEARNNKLELHSANHKELMEELDRLVGRLHIPPEVYLVYEEVCAD